MAQSQLNFKSDGSVHLWEYSPEVARSQLCRLIARMDLPISFGESDAFKKYFQIADNPRFTGVSRQTTTRDIAKYFNDRRSKLIDSLNVVSSVALTSDIWSGNAKEDYLSVVAHYVNFDWQLEKRILGMRLIDVSHNSDNIAERVSNVVAEYGLTDKIFSVTLDNASANTKAIEKLSPLLSGYIGFLEQFYESTVVLSGVYYPTAPLVLHHVLEIASHLNAFENDKVLRNVVVPMKTKYFEYWMDIPMLYSFTFILDPRAKMKGFTNVLRLLSDLNGNDYSCYLTEVRAELSEIFRKYEDKFGAVRLQRATPTGPTGKRKTNWGKIFGDGAGHGAGSIGGAGPSAGHAASAGLGTALGASAGLGAGPGASSSLSRRTSASALLQAATSGASLAADSELSSYLDSDIVNKFDDDFDILTWWQEHKLTYPILSILVRDVMTVPVSTISSESAFSLTGRIIEERRRRLTPEMVEMLALVKDWELGDSRTQHDMEDKELVSVFYRRSYRGIPTGSRVQVGFRRDQERNG
ncbi:unnamed protein product [Urochloa humidicola]